MQDTTVVAFPTKLYFCKMSLLRLTEVKQRLLD